MKKKILYFFIFSFIFVGCKQEISNRELHEKYFDKNIERCIDVLLTAGYDSIQAKEICSCAMDKAFSIDSSYMKMNVQDFSDFIRLIRSIKKTIPTDSL